MPNINKEYLFNSAEGKGDRKTRPFYLPGGNFVLKVRGSLGATGAKLILYEGALALDDDARALSANYDPQGAEITVANGSNHFVALEGWHYLALEDTSGADDCKVWIARIPNGENTSGYFDEANAEPVV